MTTKDFSNFALSEILRLRVIFAQFFPFFFYLACLWAVKRCSFISCSGTCEYFTCVLSCSSVCFTRIPIAGYQDSEKNLSVFRCSPYKPVFRISCLKFNPLPAMLTLISSALHLSSANYNCYNFIIHTTFWWDPIYSISIWLSFAWNHPLIWPMY